MYCSDILVSGGCDFSMADWNLCACSSGWSCILRFMVRKVGLLGGLSSGCGIVILDVLFGFMNGDQGSRRSSLYFDEKGVILAMEYAY